MGLGLAAWNAGGTRCGMAKGRGVGRWVRPTTGRARHWKGGLITGKDGKPAVGTLVEPTTRYVLLHLPVGATPTWPGTRSPPAPLT